MFLETSDGAKLYYEALPGDGPTVVVLHGGPGLDHTYLRPFLDPLAESARMVYLDQRAQGRSEPRDRLDGVGFDTWANDVEALRVHLGAKKLVVLGHSFGSFVALEYAARFPERVLGLVLAGCAPVFDHINEALALGKSLAEARGQPEFFERFVAAISAPVPDDAYYAEVWPTILPLYFHRFDAALVERMNAGVRYNAAAFTHGFGVCLPTFDVRGRLAGVRAPALVVVGKDDFMTPPEQGAKRVARELAGAELAVFESSGHFPFVEETGRFNELVRKLLARVA